MKKAFTLAEVLITLAIIGIVAVLTLPSLIQKYKDRAAVTHVKKVYSMLNQAWEMVTLEYGPVNEWNLYEKKGQENLVLERMSKYIKMTKKCKAHESGCIPDVTYLTINNEPYYNWVDEDDKASALLNDGTILMTAISFIEEGSYNQWLLRFYVDINGKSGPNKLGDDFFYFNVWSDNKLRPAGWYSDSETIDKEFKNNCLNENGYRCAYWVIQKGNRDYLYCKDLSFSGKSKCD